MWKRPLIFLAVLSCLATPSGAQSVAYRSEMAFVNDNDVYLFCGKDRYYTNGLFLMYRRTINTNHHSGSAIKKIWQLEAGQKMYTAHSASISHITSVDRPFAAYLYGGGQFSWFYAGESMLQGSLQTGVIGPQAMGQNLQTFVHNALNMYTIKGWQYQVNNEFEVNASFSYLHLLARARSEKADLSLQAYANAGTTFSGAGAGILLRLGRENILFQSASTHSRITADPENIRREFFFYLQPMINYVAYDATIEGGMFLQEKGPVTFKATPLVYTQETGVAYASGRWELGFAVIIKSKELKSPAKADEYGSLRMSYLLP